MFAITSAEDSLIRAAIKAATNGAIALFGNQSTAPDHGILTRSCGLLSLNYWRLNMADYRNDKLEYIEAKDKITVLKGGLFICEIANSK